MATPPVSGPMLRVVDETSAIIWVETPADCLVRVKDGHGDRTVAVVAPSQPEPRHSRSKTQAQTEQRRAPVDVSGAVRA